MVARPVILIADRVAPMRRAVRRLLGEQRFTWEEVEGEADLLRRSLETPPTLMVLEDRAAAALPRLRAQGCDAPVVQLTNGDHPFASIEGVVVVDRLQAAARLPALVEKLIANARSSSVKPRGSEIRS